MIREQIQNIDEYNQLVPLALGLMSALSRFETLVDRPRSGAGEATTSQAQSKEDDPLVLAALGALSFQRSLSRWLEVVCPPEEDVDPTSEPRIQQDPGDLLR